MSRIATAGTANLLTLLASMLLAAASETAAGQAARDVERFVYDGRTYELDGYSRLFDSSTARGMMRRHRPPVLVALTLINRQGAHERLRPGIHRRTQEHAQNQRRPHQCLHRDLSFPEHGIAPPTGQQATLRAPIMTCSRRPTTCPFRPPARSTTGRRDRCARGEPATARILSGNVPPAGAQGFVLEWLALHRDEIDGRLKVGPNRPGVGGPGSPAPAAW